MSQFAEDIARFNIMYKVPNNLIPTLAVATGPDANANAPWAQALDRLGKFKNILLEEVDEIDDIMNLLSEASPDGIAAFNKDVTALVMLADLLGDIQVYCASEMAKFGLPLDRVLEVIMLSNFSKLDRNGQPIYDERGKIQKGPDYWKPEPKIEEMIRALLSTTQAGKDAAAGTEPMTESAPDASFALGGGDTQPLLTEAEKRRLEEIERTAPDEDDDY